jgi:hypothetical protein
MQIDFFFPCLHLPQVAWTLSTQTSTFLHISELAREMANTMYV